MREQTRMSRKAYRRQLLTTVSAAVLLVSAYGIGNAEAADKDSDRSPLTIEFGGQLTRLDGSTGDVAPPFFALISSAGLGSPLSVEQYPRFSIDEFSKLSFRPDDGDWTLSASVQYGKASNKNQVQATTAPAPIQFITRSGAPQATYTPPAGKFVHTEWAATEKHLILDFQVGKDVGLGLLGNAASQIDLGVRFAQFESKSKAFVSADPTIQYPTHPLRRPQFFYSFNLHYHLYSENDYAQRTFRGIGPSVSWKGSTHIAGNPDSATLDVDWGLDAAVLFGRQTARGHHQSKRVSCPNHFYCLYYYYHTRVSGPYVTHDRSRNVTVPNVGGSLGVSFRSGDAKVSFGYRADLFVGAMDTGIDVAKKSNMFLHGPYASISIGLGD